MWIKKYKKVHKFKKNFTILFRQKPACKQLDPKICWFHKLKNSKHKTKFLIDLDKISFKTLFFSHVYCLEELGGPESSVIQEASRLVLFSDMLHSA